MTRALLFNGAAPGEPMAFGAEALAEHGIEPTLPRRVPLPAKLAAVVRDRSGVRLEQPGLLAARRADLLLGYFEPNLHWPVRLARLPGAPPLVSLVCWVAEDLLRGEPWQRERALGLLRASAVVAYLSQNQSAVFTDHGIPAERLLPVPFGVDLAPHTDPAPVERDIDLLTVGQDAGRDPATLASAIRGTDGRLTVVAPPERVGPLAGLPGVTLLGRVAYDDHLALLRRARTVVVATHELAYPTGQTVALEAAAAGCAVVVSGTAAMRDYFADGETALMPPAGDARALRTAIAALRDDAALRDRLAAAGREHVHRHHGTARMWQRLAEGLRERGVVPWS
ncbi:hypothetical protein GCM10011519_27290 [Marmoricola endophyticus]|uniref:Spore protein YkvP/CgeB glycosyl transferase-like domain-containing protein n=1 Tax=Marmoricola endophyticus TaxID=2040280 RepID=A0A917F6S0_9ACTN|nr:glycosyltransferase [Marmoricola endophyticus]GGF51804.1 hypothetical protein GCM10011519_27290 [Marmoricola endophyticus]